MGRKARALSEWTTSEPGRFGDFRKDVQQPIDKKCPAQAHDDTNRNAKQQRIALCDDHIAVAMIFHKANEET